MPFAACQCIYPPQLEDRKPYLTQFSRTENINPLKARTKIPICNLNSWGTEPYV